MKSSEMQYKILVNRNDIPMAEYKNIKDLGETVYFGETVTILNPTYGQHAHAMLVLCDLGLTYGSNTSGRHVIKSGHKYYEYRTHIFGIYVLEMGKLYFIQDNRGNDTLHESWPSKGEIEAFVGKA